MTTAALPSGKWPYRAVPVSANEASAGCCVSGHARSGLLMSNLWFWRSAAGLHMIMKTWRNC